MVEVIFTFTVSSGWANSGSLKDRLIVSHTLIVDDNGGKLAFDGAGAYVLTATVTDELGKE